MIAFSDSRSRTAWRRVDMWCGMVLVGPCYSGAGGRLNNHCAAGQEEEQD